MEKKTQLRLIVSWLYSLDKKRIFGKPFRCWLGLHYYEEYPIGDGKYGYAWCLGCGHRTLKKMKEPTNTH